jgi:hypothetical protein
VRGCFDERRDGEQAARRAGSLGTSFGEGNNTSQVEFSGFRFLKFSDAF